MGGRHRNKAIVTPASVFTVIVFSSIVKEVASGTECPSSKGPILYAYPSADTLQFSYEYDPFRTDIGILDKILTKVIDDDDVECHWEIRAKEGHHAEISFPMFKLKGGQGSDEGDCVKIYDGQNTDGTLLAELCGPATPADTYDASDRSLYVTFTQGETTGHRVFEMRYKANPRSKAVLVKIAGIVSGVIAAVVICFLAYKFSRGCRPCRRRWCPGEATDDTSNHRELRPLNLVPPSVGNGRGDNATNDQLEMQQTVLNDGASGTGEVNGAGTRINGPHTGRGGGDVGERARNVAPLPPQGRQLEEDSDDDGSHSPPPDEPPPSYDSIFGETEGAHRK